MRLQDKLETKEKTKELVNAILTSDPRLSGRRCLIDNTCENNEVYYTYCVKTSDKISTDDIEYAWGMRRGSFDIESPQNVFRVMINFDIAFNKGDLLWLPETRIIDRYFTVNDQVALFPDIDEETYSYTLIGHPKIRGMPIHRQQNINIGTDGRDTLDGVTFKTYSYPYHDFPAVISHIHPRFVILQAGKRLAEPFTSDAKPGLDVFLESYPQHKDAMEKVAAIYGAWINPFRDEDDFLVQGYETPPATLSPLPDHCPSCGRRLYYDSRDRETRDWPNGIPDWDDPEYETPPRRASPVCEECYDVGYD